MKKRRIHYLYYITLTKRERKKLIHNTSLFLKAVCSTFITVFDIMENKTIHSMIFFCHRFFFRSIIGHFFFVVRFFFRFFFFISHVRSLKNIIAKERLMKRMSSISFCRDIHSCNGKKFIEN